MSAIIASKSQAPAFIQHKRGYRVPALCAIAIAGCVFLAHGAASRVPAGLLVGLAWQQAARPGEVVTAFDSGAPAGNAQVLRGVSGVAVADGSLTTTELASLRQGEAGGVALATVDQLTAGACISLTTNAGQKHSFRIVGAKHGDQSQKQAGAAAKIELVLEPCAPGSDTILKAVIELPAGKTSALQRNL